MRSSRVSRSLGSVVALLLLYKIIYLGSVCVALLFSETLQDSEFPTSQRHSPSAPMKSLLKHFAATDGRCYLDLSEKGYKKGLRECAFFPLYPMLIRYVANITRGNDVIVAMGLANLCSLIGFLLFFCQVCRCCGESIAALALVLLLAFPGSLFFQFVYSESLFFLLLMLLWLALDNEVPTLAFGSAFFLPLARPVGIFCVFPILFYVILKRAYHERREQRASSTVCVPLCSRETDKPMAKPRWKERWFDGLLAAPFLGLTFYFSLMWHWTGNAFEGIEAQKQFGVQSIHNLFDPARFITQLFTPTEWHGFRGSLLDRCAFILLLYCLPTIWRLNRSLFAWAILLGIVPAVSGGFTSYTRFESVVFPLFIALAVLLHRPRLRLLCYVTACVFFVLHLILVWQFLNCRWAG